MYRVKCDKVARGYVVVYVMLFGMLCIMMVVICFKLEFARKRNVENVLRSTLKQSADMKCREHLFTYFKINLLNNNIILNVESITSYLEANSGSFKLVYENSSLTYDKSRKVIVVTYPLDNYYNTIEYFDFSVEGDKLKFNILHTEVKSKYT